MGKKTLNPADAQRKAERKKELNKNKANRVKAKEVATLKKDTGSIEAEIRQLEDSGKGGDLDKATKDKIASLRDEVGRIKKAKTDYVAAHPEHAKLVYPHGAPRSNAPSRSGGPDTGAGGAARSLFGKNGLPLHPERSIYYDPVLNPYGMPPPGQPYVERPLLLHEMPSASTSSSTTKPANEEDDDSDDDDDAILLPPGPPPAATDSEDSDNDIPMPEGPPPLPPGVLPPLPSGLPPLPSHVHLPPSSASTSFVPPPPPPGPPPSNIFTSFPPPPPGPPSSNLSRSFPPPPPFPPPGFVQPPLHLLRQPPPPPPQRNLQNISDPLAPPILQHHIPTVQPPPGFHPLPAKRPNTLPPLPSSAPLPPHFAQASASATISAEPELRDLKRESTAFVPTAVKRRKVHGAEKPEIK